jgi:hypothetical protein
MDKQQGHDMQHGHAGFLLKDLQQEHDMQHGHAHLTGT